MWTSPREVKYGKVFRALGYEVALGYRASHCCWVEKSGESMCSEQRPTAFNRSERNRVFLEF
jgi:hypothetical protein